MTLFNQTLSFSLFNRNRKVRTTGQAPRPITLSFSSGARKRMGWLQFLSRSHH